MGLFSETVTTYAAQTMSLIEDNPKFIPTTIQQAILTGSDISESLHSALTNNIGLKAKRYYTYGRDTYYYGLPSGTMAGYYVDMGALSAVLETIAGNPVYVDTANLSTTPDGKYFIQDWLIAHSYNNTEETFVYQNLTCSLVSAVVYADNTVRVSFTYSIYNMNTGLTETISSHVDVAAIVYVDDLYVTATYHLLDSNQLPTGSALYFTYLVSDNTYPDLSPENTAQQEAPYYPIVPIRYDNQSLTNMDAYPTAKRLVKKIGLDLNDIITGVESNPDIGSIDYAYIVIGFDIASTDAYTINYMYEYFSFLRMNSQYTKDDYDAWEVGLTTATTLTTPPVNALTIADILYKSTMYYNYITSNVVTGVLGVVGTTTKAINIKSKKLYTKTVNNHYSNFYVEQSELVLRKQITETTYEELVVTGLHHTNFVANKGKIETTLNTVVNDSDHNNFLVPLNSYIFDNVLSMKDRIDLMYDSIHIVINCRETTKLKWYQTSFFQFVMIIITIAVTIFAPPVGGGLSAATSATEVAITLATQIAVTIAAMVILKVAVKVLGLNATLAVAIAVVAAAYGMQFSGLTNLPWAADFMQIAAALPSAFNQVVAGLNSDLQAEMEDFQSMAEAKIKEVQTMLEDMEYGSTLDPLKLFRGMDYYPTEESVSDYYYRKCHVGNPGVLSLDVISDYVTNALTLTT